MTNHVPSPPSTFWQGFGRFLRGLLRLLLFALVVALVTGGIYLATPYVYRYTFLPVQNNRVLIEHVRRTQAQTRDDLNEQLAEQRERISQLEADLATEREARSELESKLAQQAETLSGQAGLAADLQAQREAITALEQSVDAVDLFLNDLDATVAKMEQDLNSPESRVAGLQAQALVLQMNQAILKARLHLAENNAGQARAALDQAGQGLARLEVLTPSSQQDELSEIGNQLETVKAAIEEQPFIALQELEILWQLLQEQLAAYDARLR